MSGGISFDGDNINNGTQIGTQNNLTQNISVPYKEVLDEIKTNHLKDMPLLDIDMGVLFTFNQSALEHAIFDTAERVATFIPHSGRTFGIKNNSDIGGITPSLIRRNDILIIEPCIAPRDGDLVLLCLDYGGANRGVIVRLSVDLMGNRTVKRDDNPPEPMPKNSLLCGVVVEIKRRLLDTALVKARLNPRHNPLNTLEPTTANLE